MVKDGKVLQCLLDGLALRGKVFLLVTCIRLLAQQLFRVLGHLFQIAQIVHVGIKACSFLQIGTHADYRHHRDGSNEQTAAVEGTGIDTVDEPRERFRLVRKQ